MQLGRYLSCHDGWVERRGWALFWVLACDLLLHGMHGIYNQLKGMDMNDQYGSAWLMTSIRRAIFLMVGVWQCESDLNRLNRQTYKPKLAKLN